MRGGWWGGPATSSDGNARGSSLMVRGGDSSSSGGSRSGGAVVRAGLYTIAAPPLPTFCGAGGRGRIAQQRMGNPRAGNHMITYVAYVADAE